jgi:hypothetical protein
MPSSKDPVTTVQPGPGLAADGSVNPTSLSFPVSFTGSTIAAHINDPAAAHNANAISTSAYGGTLPWSIPAGSSLAGALTEVFNGLNSRPAYVLDASVGATNADFAGPNALINAIAAVGTRVTFYLRTGQYSWNNSVILAGTTIIGAGSPTATTNYVEIVSSANSNHFRFSDGASVRNVLLTTNAGGNLTLSASATAGGGCAFDNVHFKLSGRTLYVDSSRNVFRQCITHSTATSGVRLIESGGYNLYESCSFEQVSVTTAGTSGGNSVFSALKIGSATLAVPLPSAPLLSVSASFNVFNSVSGGHIGALTAVVLSVTGSSNAFRSVAIDGFNTSVEALGLSTGSNNTFDNTTIINGTACTGQSASAIVQVLGADSVFSNLRIVGCSVTGTTNSVLRFGPASNSNAVNNLTVATTTGAGYVVYFDGVTNKLSGALITSAGRFNSVFFGASAVASSFTNARIGYFAVDANAVGIIHIGGNTNTVANIEMSEISGIQAGTVLVRCLGSAHRVSGVRANAIAILAGSTGHAGFAFVFFQGATNCRVENVELRDSLNLSTVDDADTGLIGFDGSKGCTLDGLVLSYVGTVSTRPIGSILFQTGTTAAINQRCTVRNVYVDSTTRFRGASLFNIDQTRWDGLTLAGIHLSVSTTGPLIAIQGGWNNIGPNYPVSVVDCYFNNTSTTTGGWGGVHISGNPKFEFTGCRFAVSAGFYCAYILGPDTNLWQWWGGSFTDCSFQANGTEDTRAVHCTAGVKFVRCIFAGSTTSGATGSFGVQLFSGYGAASAGGVRVMPMVLEDCQMLLGRRNFDATSETAVPQVFLGGAANAAQSHGPIVVRGLTIKRNPSSVVAAWHRGQTLCIDTLNQVAGTASSYSDIVIDLENVPFSSPGYKAGPDGPFDFIGVSALSPIPNRLRQGAVVEINGSTASGATRTTVKGLSVLRISRMSGGPAPVGENTAFIAMRAIIAARGVSLQDLVVDAAAGLRDTSAGYGAAAISVDSCDLDNVQLWPTTSIPICTDPGLVSFLGPEHGAHIDAQSSTLTGVHASTWQTSSVPEADRLALLRNSTLANSRFELPFRARFHSGIFHAIGSRVTHNNVSCEIHGADEYDTVMMVLAEHLILSEATLEMRISSKVLNNTFINRAVQTASAGFSTGPSSRGGGARIESYGDYTEIIGNTILNHWNTGTHVSYHIHHSGGDNVSIVNNRIVNYALPGVAVAVVAGAPAGGGGTAGISIGSGLFHSILGNVIVAENTGASRVLISMPSLGANTSRSIVMGNCVHNKVSNVDGAINLSIGGTDRPTTPASYNTIG